MGLICGLFTSPPEAYKPFWLSTSTHVWKCTATSSYQTQERPGDKRVVMPSPRLRLRRSATPSCWGVLRIECSRRMPASVRKRSNSPDEYSPPMSLRGIWILRPVTFSAHTLYRFKPKNVGLTTDKVDRSKWGEVLHDRYPIATGRRLLLGSGPCTSCTHGKEEFRPRDMGYMGSTGKLATVPIFTETVGIRSAIGQGSPFITRRSASKGLSRA